MELQTTFQKDLKIGDEMIIFGSHVVIDKIELVIHWKSSEKPPRKKLLANEAIIPMINCENPFPYTP